MTNEAPDSKIKTWISKKFIPDQFIANLKYCLP